MSAPARWPVHPPPGELESLSSWLERLGRLYEVPVTELLGPNLGVVKAVSDLDEDPPPEIFPALSQASGVEVGRLRAMTLPGQVPWLFDRFPLPARDGEEAFYTYVRQDSVLLAPGEAPHFEVTRRRAWRGPWIPATRLRRSCPLCTAAPVPRWSWTWDLPLTIGCTIHHTRLLSPEERLHAELSETAVVTEPIGEPVAALDNYTHQALTTGMVALPGRRVHAGVWFRLLRCLLDELTLSTAALRKHSAATLTHVWEAADLTYRAGLRIWQPYEWLPWQRQHDLLTAAALVVDLAARGRLHPRGTLGALLTAPGPEQVYPGDVPYQPRPSRPRPPGLADLRRPVEFAVLVAELEDAVRTDAETARQVLGFLIHNDPSPANFDRERELLIATGMPPHFVQTRTEIERLLALYGYESAEIDSALTDFTRERRGLHGPAAQLFSPDDLVQLCARLNR
ncbi:TniQ family protein [Nocardia aurantiaca]|uniref:TniQ domain-containing protein n=1 Tax=Nocardia aurantiaca TaxID=2675850 RepID=A0A6I3L4Z0_9NOCA|nr:TniQ family protein [Nocardia aurantiaca]MTE16917.1 hypothetical protein [Nocardia aurantiaca]